MNKLTTFLGLTVLMAVQTEASLVNYSSESSFDAQGTIVYDSFFNDFGTGFGFPGNPFTRGGVTYNSTQNLTWGDTTGYTTTQTLIGNNFWTPVLGTIASGYSMFGFDIGTYNSSRITISISTSLGTYIYPSLTIANSQIGQLQFMGFVASPGEYFTGFDISADNGPGNLPGITDVKLGNTGTSAVPEPTTVISGALMLLPFGSSVLRQLRKKFQAA
jgi:hypothetical protein